jgi:L-fuculose-phosphate aldolase
MLCLVDVATGEKRAGRLKASSETKTHLALYRARPDVGGIVHTHSVYASAHAAARAPIPALVEDMAQVVGGTVECADYALAGTQALADNVVRGLGSRSAVLLANHGVFGVGPSVPEALRVCQIVEKAAWIHVLARTLGTPAVLPPEDVERLRDGYLHAYGQRTS